MQPSMVHDLLTHPLRPPNPLLHQRRYPLNRAQALDAHGVHPVQMHLEHFVLSKCQTEAKQLPKLTNGLMKPGRSGAGTNP